MNIISIDSSTSCTAMFVNDHIFVYGRYSEVMGKTGMRKHFLDCSSVVNIRTIDKAYTQLDSDKIKYFKEMATMMYNDIKYNIDNNKESICFMEGYSYSSSAGMIIDLVSIGTLIRFAIVKLGIEYEIVPPSTLKLETCKLIYGDTIVKYGKKKQLTKIIHVNKDGVSGGHFKKPDMARAIIESEFNDVWSNFLRKMVEVNEKTKSIKKPYEDLNDAYLLRKTGEHALRRDKRIL